MPERLLLTPGPLTTTARTRAALNRDWGSRDSDFVKLSNDVRARLASLAGASTTHAAILLQGSATFAMEAALQTLVPRTGKLLVLINGAYGRRIVTMATRMGLACDSLTIPENAPILPESVERALTADAVITDVAVVHCETTTGLLNPLEAIASLVSACGRRLLIDAISSFGAVPIDASRLAFSALVGSANKGLQGVPGMAFVLADTAHLAGCRGRARSLSLDLFDQWQGFTSNGQWRFTPPVQVVAALAEALDELVEEGGVPARHARYQENCAVLLDGMGALGFDAYIDRGVQAPVIVTFRMPAGGWFDFEDLYRFLHARGIVIYPGKLTREASFRIGCIGAVDAGDMRRAVAEVAAFVAQRRQKAWGDCATPPGPPVTN
jgi:2-aminoethylphosphonate-pyruvate transaminase